MVRHFEAQTRTQPSAHQNIPTGGYGMNMGLGDAYDIGWKLAAVVNGWGGEHLLSSFEAGRRPVALRNGLEQSRCTHGGPLENV